MLTRVCRRWRSPRALNASDHQGANGKGECGAEEGRSGHGEAVRAFRLDRRNEYWRVRSLSFSEGLNNLFSIIAIMLGRLEMDVDECIEEYTNMFETIFGRKGLPMNMWGKIKGRFDSAVLEQCIKGILKKRGLAEDAFLNDGKERCKVYAFLFLQCLI